MVESATLLLDCGNSAIKYQLGERSGRLETVAEVVHLVRTEAVAQAVVASVSRFGQQLEHALAELPIPCRRLRVIQGWAGLTLCYGTPETLGIDRWLTLVALTGRPDPALIVDAGTALTIDWLDPGHHHRGGYILPGLRLMRRSLVDDTFALPAVSGDAGAVSPGQSTGACIANGTLLALAAAVDAAADASTASAFDVVWTGGDAPRLRALSRYPGQYRPDLIFDGMRRLLDDPHYMETLL
ncbi:MAG: type III pantothenate kinase [Saccharospirillum sp.]